MDSGRRLVEDLAASGKWSRNHAFAAVRAGFKYECSGLDLLTDAQRYKLWQLDHIVANNLRAREASDPDDPSNQAIARKPCTFEFKWKFDPRIATGPNASRAALISDTDQRGESEDRKK